MCLFLDCKPDCVSCIVSWEAPGCFLQNILKETIDEGCITLCVCSTSDNSRPQQRSTNTVFGKKLSRIKEKKYFEFLRNHLPMIHVQTNISQPFFNIQKLGKD